MEPVIEETTSIAPLAILLSVAALLLIICIVCYCKKQSKIRAENEKLAMLQKKKQQEALLRSR